MIRPLSAEGADVEVTADVHVIGGGIAGLLLASRLARRGKRVVVSESGGERDDGGSHPLNEVVHLRSVYHGAGAGRARGLGGTSALWGGALIPFLPADLDADGGWPVAHSALSAYLPEVERLFGLPAGPYEDEALVTMREGASATFVPRSAKWPPFSKRNVAALLDDHLRDDAGPQVWTDATATGFHHAPDGTLEYVVATAGNGRTLTVRAREVVLAAGALESTRLLLLLDRQAGNAIFAPDDVLGRYFHEHISACVADVHPRDRKALNRVAGFRFEGGGMRNLRFEPVEDAALRRRVPPSFAHIAFSPRPGSGFEVLRDLFRTLQRRRLPNAAALVSLARAAPWLTQALWWRTVEHRLLYPADAGIEAHVVVEQAPVATNRIALSPDRYDAFGLPLASVDWEIGEEDRQRLIRTADAFAHYWQHSSLEALGSLSRRPEEDVLASLDQGGSIHHPGGSTRMGRTPADGVVDADLRCFRIPNLSVAATSVFPTGGGANPTMMLILATLRLADRLANH